MTVRLLHVQAVVKASSMTISRYRFNEDEKEIYQL